MRIHAWGLALSILLWGLSAEAAGGVSRAENAIAGGFGLQAGLSDWTPGGFKWFNEYSRGLTDLVWLNFQLNMVAGNMDDRHCWYDKKGRLKCDYDHWKGNAVELVFGVKLRWEMRNLPIVIDAKLGGAVDLLLLGVDYVGIGFGFRGGAGVHYFLVPNFGIGVEIASTIGPSIISDGPGAELLAALDFQLIGVEYRW